MSLRAQVLSAFWLALLPLLGLIVQWSWRLVHQLAQDLLVLGVLVQNGYDDVNALSQGFGLVLDDQVLRF